jgi:hypothetical protein
MDVVDRVAATAGPSGPEALTLLVELTPLRDRTS